MRFELLSAPQGEVLRAYRESRSRVQLIMGPLGSGKTFESCQKIFNFMCTQRVNAQGLRKSRWYAIRNTYPDLLSTTVKDWMELFGELGRYKGGGMEPPCHYLSFRLADRSVVRAELLFLALDRPQSIKKLRGAQVTGFWLNEAKELDKAVIDMADLRHGRYPSAMDGGPSWHGMIGDTNAPDDDSWYYELAEEDRPDDWEFFRQPGGLFREIGADGKWTGQWLENPDAENLDNLPEGYYVKGMEGKKGDWIAVNLANEYGSVMDGKPIYERQWNEAMHLAREPIGLVEGLPIAVGLDFGLTPAAVIGQQDAFGQVRVLEELVATGMGIKQFVKSVLKPALRARYRGVAVDYVGDPAGNKRAETDEETVFKVLSDLGIECLPANSNNPDIRWEAVRDYLESLSDGRPAFLLSPTCKVLRKGFNGGYRLRRIKIIGEAKFHTKADKNKFSHPHDALQYLCMYYRGEYGEEAGDFERHETADSWGN